MVKIRRVLSNRNDLRWMIIIITIFCIALGLTLQALRSLNSPYPKAYFFINYIYFTTQSNILILVLLILHFTRFKNRLIYDVFIHIGLLNILMTCIVFHLFLGPYMEVSIVQHLLHTVSPILYLFFYFFIYDNFFKIKHLATLFIYPILYASSVYFIIEPRIGNTLEMVQGDFQGARYIYPFFDPFYYNFKLIQMLLFFIFVFILVLLIFLILTQPAKRYIERKYKEDNSI